MKLKNLLFLLAILPIVALTSCAGDDDKEKMTNYVQLSVNGSTSGATTIAEDATEPVVINVLLSYFKASSKAKRIAGYASLVISSVI